MGKQERNYKDSVFTDLFARDEKALPKALSLCNALLDTHYSDEGVLRNVTLENVMYTGVKNDIAYLLDSNFIVLMEHQSTINENMPLRFLLYIAREYESILEDKQRYARSLQKIAAPRFYVLYNGIDEYPLQKKLKLSDAFTLKTADTSLELICTVININSQKKSPMLDSCQSLKEYSSFVEEVRMQIAKDKEKGYDRAIKSCIKKGILREYLLRKAKEIKNMLIADYDYAADIAVQREEALELGRQEGIKEGRQEGIKEGRQEGAYQKARETAQALKKMGLALSQIAKGTGLSEVEIEQLPCDDD